MTGLTPKQARFVEEYLVDLNATQAAIRAGYSKRTANEQGAQLLAKLSIAEAVAKAKAERSERVEITADYVLSGLREVAERCMARAPVMVGRGSEREQAKDGDGNHIWTFDASGANKSFELLGKHIALFTEKHEVSGQLGLLPMAAIDDFLAPHDPPPQGGQ